MVFVRKNLQLQNTDLFLSFTIYFFDSYFDTISLRCINSKFKQNESDKVFYIDVRNHNFGKHSFFTIQ